MYNLSIPGEFTIIIRSRSVFQLKRLFNIKEWNRRLENYQYKVIGEYLEFRLNLTLPVYDVVNHPYAYKYPNEAENYIN